MGGLRSAMTYAGAKDILDFQEKAQLFIATDSARNEGKPWLKNVIA